MMSHISLTLFKKHVRSDEFSDDDEILRHYLDAAEEQVGRDVNRPLADLETSEGSLPKAIEQAVMMLAAHWYNQREAVSSGQMQGVPYGYEALVKPWRRLV